MVIPPGFDEDYGTYADWAKAYRQRGIQVVPANGKMPGLKAWKDLQQALAPQDRFDQWYGPGGQFVGHGDMGMLTGSASGRVLMIDLDLYKPGGQAAETWWQGVLAVHNNGMELETWEQLTGGGGRQKFFRYPLGWKGAVNAKTDLNIDTRGQGGFAVLPPSLHASGKHYEWLEGCAPWECELCEAPLWLLEEVDRLVKEHGGGTGGNGGGQARQHDGGGKYDGFGHQRDFREEKMRDLIWGAIVDWRRECPIKPGPAEQNAKMMAKYRVYEDLVTPQGVHPNSLNKTDQLEAEGRGPTAFHVKWQYAMNQWDEEVAEEARKAAPQKGGADFRDYTEEFAKAKVDPVTGQPLPLILTAEEFLQGFVPPDYLVVGMLQRSTLVSLTARTGHGKTTVAMLLGTCIARGVPFNGRRTKQGGVLFLAGENPDDIRGRYLALASHEGFDPHGIPFHFVDGVINIQTSMAQIRAETEKIPNLSLVIVDTQAAYFLGDEGNSNEQQGWFARLLRELIKLPGRPLVLVNCHPVKNATQDNLVPMGGSAFINEVDANLTLWADDKTCVLGPHPDKWRGVMFEMVAFELRTVVTDRLKDSDGQHIPSVIAVPITDEGAERRAAVADEDAKIVLRLVHAERNASISSIARNAGWFWPDGKPAKSKVQKILDRMLKGKAVYRKFNGKYRLTKAGCREIGVKWESPDDEE